MMYTVRYSEALELKKYLADRGLEYVHFHDQCGGQFFSFDAADAASKNAVVELWRGKGLGVSFTEDDLTFVVTEE